MKIRRLALGTAMTGAVFTALTLDKNPYPLGRAPFDTYGRYRATSGNTRVLQVDVGRKMYLERRRKALAKMLKLREHAVSNGLRLLNEEEFYEEMAKTRSGAWDADT